MTEKAKLNAKMIRRHFQAGEQLLKQGVEINSAHFVFSGIVQVTRQVEDGRVLNMRKLGPGDSFGDISLLIGMQSVGNFTALTSGLLLQLNAEDLKPILESRPELDGISEFFGEQGSANCCDLRQSGHSAGRDRAARIFCPASRTSSIWRHSPDFNPQISRRRVGGISELWFFLLFSRSESVGAIHTAETVDPLLALKLRCSGHERKTNA